MQSVFSSNKPLQIFKLNFNLVMVFLAILGGNYFLGLYSIDSDLNYWGVKDERY